MIRKIDTSIINVDKKLERSNSKDSNNSIDPFCMIPIPLISPAPLKMSSVVSKNKNNIATVAYCYDYNEDEQQNSILYENEQISKNSKNSKLKKKISKKNINKLEENINLNKFEENINLNKFEENINLKKFEENKSKKKNLYVDVLLSVWSELFNKSEQGSIVIQLIDFVLKKMMWYSNRNNFKKEKMNILKNIDHEKTSSQEEDSCGSLKEEEEEEVVNVTSTSVTSSTNGMKISEDSCVNNNLFLSQHWNNLFLSQ